MADNVYLIKRPHCVPQYRQPVVRRRVHKGKAELSDKVKNGRL